MTAPERDEPPRERMSLSLPADLVRWTRAKAAAENRTISAVVEKALRNMRTVIEDTRRRGG